MTDKKAEIKKLLNEYVGEGGGWFLLTNVEALLSFSSKGISPAESIGAIEIAKKILLSQAIGEME